VVTGREQMIGAAGEALEDFEAKAGRGYGRSWRVPHTETVAGDSGCVSLPWKGLS